MCFFLSPSNTTREKLRCRGPGIKLALEEWRHWLEGTAQPFIVWTYHKNLAYLQSANHLNACQARCALFSLVSIFPSPGSRNVKQDALSRQFAVTEGNADSAPVLPASFAIGSLGRLSPPGPVDRPRSWEWTPRSALCACFHLRSRTALGTHGLIYLSSWVHRTIAFLQQYFWWPTLSRNVREYVLACSVWVQNKSSS